MSAPRDPHETTRSWRGIDPELTQGIARSLAAVLPAGPLTVDVVRTIDARLAGWAAIDDVELVEIERRDGSALDLRVHPGPADDAAVMWLHGGGMFLGAAWCDDVRSRELSAGVGTTVVVPDYRLAPEHPYPAALDDAMLAFRWMTQRFARVVVAGASAGGGLAAAVALRARAEAGPVPVAQHLYYPMLDDRETRSRALLAEAPVWNSRLDRLAWDSYLGGRSADGFAAPARTVDLRDLPPCYIETGEFDLFRDEDLDFARRLAEAGVPVELHLERGAVHGFDAIAPDATISRAARRRREAALRRDLGGRP